MGEGEELYLPKYIKYIWYYVVCQAMPTLALHWLDLTVGACLKIYDMDMDMDMHVLLTM